MKILSLKSVLLYQLGRTLLCRSKANEICFTDFLHQLDDGNSACNQESYERLIDWREIPLKRKQSKHPNTSQILYVSALPQVLAASSQVRVGTNPETFLKTVVNRLDQSRSNLKTKSIDKQAICSDRTLPIEARLWLEFEIETQRSGWVGLSLTEKGQSDWLNFIQAQPFSSSRGGNRLSTNSRRSPALQSKSNSLSNRLTSHSVAQMLWQVQYAHACCARLLAGFSEPAKTAPADLQPQSLSCTSQSLVRNLIDTADSLFWIPYRWPTQQYLLLLKRAMPLCQAFELFYRSCEWHDRSPRERGEKAAIAPPKALVSATQNILKVLLEEHLGEKAPIQL